MRREAFWPKNITVRLYTSSWRLFKQAGVQIPPSLLRSLTCLFVCFCDTFFLFVSRLVHENYYLRSLVPPFLGFTPLVCRYTFPP